MWGRHGNHQTLVGVFRYCKLLPIFQLQQVLKAKQICSRSFCMSLGYQFIINRSEIGILWNSSKLPLKLCREHYSLSDIFRIVWTMKSLCVWHLRSTHFTLFLFLVTRRVTWSVKVWLRVNVSAYFDGFFGINSHTWILVICSYGDSCLNVLSAKRSPHQHVGHLWWRGSTKKEQKGHHSWMLKLNQGQSECYPVSHLCSFTLLDIFY